MTAQRRMGRRAVAVTWVGLVVAMLLGAPLIQAVSAVEGGNWADFGRPMASSSFERGVSFRQSVTLTDEAFGAELLLRFANSAATTVIEVDPPTNTGAQTLTYQFDPAVDGQIQPNTPIIARWRLKGVDPTDVALGPEVRVTYADDRFDWRTESDDLVRVHWYEGSNAFGARALKIGEDGVQKASELLGVSETEPVDFFVYADQDAFYDALGPGTRENVGGQANAEIRTMFALITPDEIDDPWVKQVIPHELTHLVFDTAAKNPYHFPPRWLNEGLAVYLSQGYDASDRGAVESAASDGSLIALDGLTGQFPTSYERFSLAYSESVSAVDYLIRTHGDAALVSLIRSYADGRTDDEAFEAALGADMTAFGAAWLDDLGAQPPTRYGPQPAAPGPVPVAWGGTGSSTGSPSGGSSPAPGETAPGAPTVAKADDTYWIAVALVIVVSIGLIGVVVVLGRRQARALSQAPSPWAAPVLRPASPDDSPDSTDSAIGRGPPE